MNIFKKTLFLVLSAGLLSIPSTLNKVETVEAAETRTIYLNPSSNWREADAHFEAWVWGGAASDAWYDFTDPDGDGYYEISIPSDMTGMIVMRKQPGTTHGWDSWGQTGDIVISQEYNCLSNSGWDTSFTWSTYNPNLIGDESYILAGEFGAVGTPEYWNGANEDNKFTHNPEKHRYEFSKFLYKGVKFKFVTNGNWYGYDLAEESAKNYSVSDGTNDKNFVANYTGTYTFYVLDEETRTSGIKLGIEFNGHLQFYVQKATDNSASVRLLATFGDAVNNKDLALYDEVGLDITFNDQTVSVDAGYIYDSIIADGNTYTANDYGAQHFFCITLRNVPNNAEFTVTPYARLLDSTVERGYTYSYTFTA